MNALQALSAAHTALYVAAEDAETVAAAEALLQAITDLTTLVDRAEALVRSVEFRIDDPRNAVRDDVILSILLARGGAA
jgi:hypothetical protein